MAGLEFCTESEARQLVIDTVRKTDTTATVFVYKRELRPESFTYDIEFGIRTFEGNSELILNFLKESLNNTGINFSKSEMHIQDTLQTTDYIFVKAVITPNLG